jgi:glycosyltransferase involved in cell wall biosynthesis
MAIMNVQPRIAYVSTYPPRACGIATFTRDLARAMLMRGQVDHNLVVSIENNAVRCRDGMAHTIDQHKRGSYISAAQFLNETDTDVLSLQHEFGIFGGEWGEYVLDLCRNLEVPLVTTFHTVLRNPPEKARQIVREISQRSNRVVVTIESAAKILEKHFGIEAEKIVVVHHGAALPDSVLQEHAKSELGLRGRTVLATYGLISSGKGIEFAIRSLSHLVTDRPNLLYLVIGETHPEVRKHEGEIYRNKLIALAKRLGVTRNVRFINRYLRDDELSLYLQATDIYLAPYLAKDQVSSGTITLALGHGKAVISTPTIFAKEILRHNRGLLCKFANAPSIAKCVKEILGNSGRRQELEGNASIYGQEVGWSRVAEQYGDVFRSAMGTRRTVVEAATVSET